MIYPEAYINYLVHYHGSRDYFECHEILEDYWKEVDPGNKNSHWVGFILIAVSAYHHRRNNFIGAEKTLVKAINIMKNTPENVLSTLGINVHAFFIMLDDNLEKIRCQQSYLPSNLPIIHDDLLALCQKVCKQGGYIWCQLNFKASDYLINRHKLRDRSEIIKERVHQKLLRQQKNS
ncbi:DUF309 domain-containing protein [Bacillus massiliigorillae]|uniref:DUF309 domain-containing protein n=1 Tax=Bacillus massiliigorillae TaxID=1243664 RepID=UPI00039AA545|nr:DUF309 domain-containing protein [Bacillus massiliigorillae]